MTGDRNGKDVLNPLAVYLHAQARQGVRLDRRGGLHFGLEDDRPRWQANQHVGTLSFVQRLSHSREPKTLTQQPGQYVVDDAFVASVSVSWGCHAEYVSTDVRGNQCRSAPCIDHLKRRSPSVGPVDTTSIRRHAVGAGLKPALPRLPINSSFPSLPPRSRGTGTHPRLPITPITQIPLITVQTLLLCVLPAPLR